jgi:hypothetical protein
VLDAAALAQARRSGAARAQGSGVSFIERARKEEEGAERHALEEKRWRPLIALITCSYSWRNEGATVFGERCDAGGEQDACRKD